MTETKSSPVFGKDTMDSVRPDPPITQAEAERIRRNATHPSGVDTSRPVHRSRGTRPEIHPERYESATTTTRDTIAQYTLPPDTIIFNEDGEEIGRIEKPTPANVTEIKRPEKDRGPAPTFTFEAVYPLGKDQHRLSGIVQKIGELWVGQTPEAVNKQK